MVQGNHRILTGKNADSIKKTQVSQAQETYVKAISNHAESRYKKLKAEGKLDKIKVYGDKLLIKVELEGNKLIIVPDSAKLSGQIQKMTIWKLSPALKEKYPELEEGQEVEVNPRILQFGNGHFLEWIDSSHNLIYKINFDHVEAAIG